MALSNAERQRRWRQRLRAAATGQSGLLDRLNAAFADGYVSAVAAFATDHPDDGRDWGALRSILLEPAPPADEDFWLAHAHDEGATMGRLVAGRIHGRVLEERHTQSAPAKKRRPPRSSA